MKNKSPNHSETAGSKLKTQHSLTVHNFTTGERYLFP